MKRFKYGKIKKNTMKILFFIVFFCVIINSLILFNYYGKNITTKGVILIQEKLDKIIYQFFTDLVTDKVINVESTNDLLKITKNSKEEVVSVDYDLEKTYKTLTNTSKVIKNALSNLENGKIDVKVYDKYLDNSKSGLILNIPLFLSSDNIFLNNLGPKIPIVINFNGALLTNIKTKVTNYGLNNALLEIYITVEMDKLIITPIVQDNEKFYYDILIGALVINGSVPKFYGSSFESNSSILDIPLS